LVDNAIKYSDGGYIECGPISTTKKSLIRTISSNEKCVCGKNCKPEQIEIIVRKIDL